MDVMNVPAVSVFPPRGYKAAVPQSGGYGSHQGSRRSPDSSTTKSIHVKDREHVFYSD